MSEISNKEVPLISKNLSAVLNDIWSGDQAESLQTWRANKQYHLMTCASCVIAQDTAYAGVTRICCRCKVVLPLQPAEGTQKDTGAQV